MKYKQLTPFNFDMYLPILLFFQCVDVDNKSKIHIYHLKKKSITSLIHLSRQDTHSTNFHRFLSGWIGPFDRILPVFLFTQMHNGPCWNKNFAHKECWPYIYNLIKNSKMRYYHISFLEFSLVGLEFLKIFFLHFFGRKNFLPWWDSPLSQLPEEFLHLDILPHHTDYSQKIIKDCNSFTRRNPTCVCDCKIPECFRSFYPMHTAGWN